MTELRPYSVAVVLADGDGSALLSVVSALHRRGVEVLDAELTRSAAGRRSFTATFVATCRQARTVEGSLRNLVHVIRAEVSEAADRSHDTTAGGPVTLSRTPTRSHRVRRRRRSGPVAG